MEFLVCLIREQIQEQHLQTNKTNLKYKEVYRFNLTKDKYDAK